MLSYSPPKQPSDLTMALSPKVTEFNLISAYPVLFIEVRYELAVQLNPKN